MRDRALSFVFIALLTAGSGVAHAQAVWQPTPPPLVTAENETWYRAGSAIEWNGDFYYPAGAPQPFNPYQMVRAGSYRGIPLYTDATLEPYSIAFVPIGGGRMQPYERPRTGMLASTTGSQAPSFPPETFGALSVTTGGFVAQAPAPPTFARPYDLAPTYAPPAATVEMTPTSAPAPTGTTGQALPGGERVVGTRGRSIVTTTNRTASTAIAPKGINGAWIEYDGRRWISRDKAVELTSDMHAIGNYRGFTVYARDTDRSTIYVPSTGDLVVPYHRR